MQRVPPVPILLTHQRGFTSVPKSVVGATPVVNTPPPLPSKYKRNVSCGTLRSEKHRPSFNVLGYKIMNNDSYIDVSDKE